MSTDPYDAPYSTDDVPVTPLEVLQRADEKSETRYSLVGMDPIATPTGDDYTASAVDAGGQIRDVRVVVPFGDDLTVMKDRLGTYLSAISQLRNPNLGVAEAVVAVNGGWGVVLPAAQGQALEELIEGGPLPPRTAAEIGLEVAWALAAAHAAVVPDRIRPVALPHGDLRAENVLVSGLGEVVLADYNLHSARALVATPADDIEAMGRLLVHLIDGAEMPVLPADPELARTAIDEDLKGLPGLSDDLRALLCEMLDPEPGERPDVRSVARRLRRAIPDQEGLWLSSWAEVTIGLPERERPTFSMPTPTLVSDEPDRLAEPSEAATEALQPRDENPLYVKKGRGQGKVQLRMPPALMAILVLLVVGGGAGGFQLARSWLDLHGPLDMADALTEQAGATNAATAGPIAPASRDKSKGEEEVPTATDVTVLPSEAGLQAPDDASEEEPERELVEEDEAIDAEEETEEDADGAEGAAAPDEATADEATDAAEEEEAAEEEGTTDDKDGEPASGDDPVPAEEDADDGETEATETEATETEATGTATEAAPTEEADASAELSPEAVEEPDAEDEEEPVVERPPPRPNPWPRPASALGELDLFVEVPLATKVQLRCTNGLSVSGPSAFRADIQKTPATRCLVRATMPGDVVAQAPIDLNRSLDLICRHGFHTELRCVQRSGEGLEPELPTAVELEQKRFELRVRAPMAESMRVACIGRTEAEDIERLTLTDVPVGPCRVTANMPDGPYAGSFMVVDHGEFMCMRDYAGPVDADGRRPLRCATMTPE